MMWKIKVHICHVEKFYLCLLNGYKSAMLPLYSFLICMLLLERRELLPLPDFRESKSTTKQLHLLKPLQNTRLFQLPRLQVQCRLLERSLHLTDLR